MTNQPRWKLRVLREPGESSEHWGHRMQEFVVLTSDPHMLVEATGPPTPDWTKHQVDAWEVALRRTRPRWVERD